VTALDTADKPAWQIFGRKRGGGRPAGSSDPVAMIDSEHGCLRFNPTARALIGAPGYVLLVYDPAAEVVGIRPATTEPERYRVNPSSGSVSIRALLLELGCTPPPGPRRVHVHGDTLYVHLHEEPAP
jgi:hypothetical protein